MRSGRIFHHASGRAGLKPCPSCLLQPWRALPSEFHRGVAVEDLNQRLLADVADGVPKVNFVPALYYILKYSIITYSYSG
jgi:hypothetical protein